MNPDWDMRTPPSSSRKAQSGCIFLALAELTMLNPPHANDHPILLQMRRVGIEPGKPFEFDRASPEIQRALTEVGPAALNTIKAKVAKAGVAERGMAYQSHRGRHLRRGLFEPAAVAYLGIGANTIEDAVYPTAFTDADGKPFSSDSRHILHFNKNQILPVRAFWSLTMYNERQLLAANPIDRFAIGDRDQLAFNPDGSLDLYIQRESPGRDKESNGCRLLRVAHSR